ncbi:hypothetical protein J2T12_000130 [Paenibacillus anaericanus]|uniref:hypothetical protein n=1 Tax=Paenibacillus anaericanus TaxID=170367 RepID=UPI002782706F|nr:hypothetical protein [Paenibacillus anaericanus]MDQ0086736.1 hypothetical protein [Paenibacillus anaericanus]
MYELQRIEHEREEAVNPHQYLLSVSAEDVRCEKVKQFWQLEPIEAYWPLVTRLRKQRSKHILLAMLNDRYCKGNIEIFVNHEERTIMFRYRGTTIGIFSQKIMTFIPVYADLYEASYSTISQRKSAKRAIEEVVMVILGDHATTERISLAYREFLVLLFGAVPQQPSDLWVSREAYIEAMNTIEDKYGLDIGDSNFLEWRLTLLGRSPMIINAETKERL